MRYVTQPLLVTLAFIPLLATADLLECVDPDIAAVFLHTGYSPPQLITREMPENFPAFKPPKGFEFIGSSTQSNTIKIAFKTSLSLRQAQDAIASSLEASDFERQPIQHRSSQGFQTRKNLPLSLAMCGADNEPPIYVSTRSEATGTYVTVSKMDPRSRQMGCRELNDHMRRSTTRFMPDLVLPPDSRNRMSSGSGGGNDNASAHVRFRTNYQLDQLKSFFNTQIAEQGWSLESDWTGSVGDGSIWSAEREGYRLSANLQVVGHTANEYTAVFSIWQFESRAGAR